MGLKDIRQVDVIVVGAGNAAMCAAFAAHDASASVAVLERAPESECGGNSAFTGGATRFSFDNVDELREVLDLTDEEVANTDFGTYTDADFLEDMGRVTQYRCDPDLTEIFVCNSRKTLAWMKSKGVRFEAMYGRQVQKVDGKFKFFAGLVCQTWGAGRGLVDSLHKIARKNGIPVLYETSAVSLIRTEGGVRGVIAASQGEEVELKSSAVVLASGGFESNAEMRGRYLGPNWDLAKVRGTRFNMGDGIRMALADVPTIAESGYAGYETLNWFGIVAPVRTPDEAVRKLNSTIVAAVNLPEVRQHYENRGAEPITTTPEEMQLFLRNEIEKWAEVVRISGARVD